MFFKKINLISIQEIGYTGYTVTQKLTNFPFLRNNFIEFKSLAKSVYPGKKCVTISCIDLLLYKKKKI
jgi:hypothetical protein